MIDAEIELVMDPGGIDVAQQRERLVDQIVVIEQAAARFFVVIAPQHLVGDGDSAAERSRQITARRRSQQRANAVLFRVQALDQARHP